MVIVPLTGSCCGTSAALRGQVFTIALVVGAGIASLVGLRSTFTSLVESRDAYYEQLPLRRGVRHAPSAPRSRWPRDRGDPGRGAGLHPGGGGDPPAAGDRRRAVDEWSTGRLVSLPGPATPPLNGLHLRTGPLARAAPARRGAGAGGVRRGLSPAARASGPRAVINGKQRDLRVVGTALSPEYVYALRPGALTDEFGRFGILWMSRRALAAAFQQRGSFNDVSLALQPGPRRRGHPCAGPAAAALRRTRRRRAAAIRAPTTSCPASWSSWTRWPP